MKARHLVAAALLGAAAFAAPAADKVKIGFIGTLSGPNASVGVDIRDAFQLAIKLNGGKLGGLPVELLIGDDGAGTRPAAGGGVRVAGRGRLQAGQVVTSLDLHGAARRCGYCLVPRWRPPGPWRCSSFRGAARRQRSRSTSATSRGRSIRAWP